MAAHALEVHVRALENVLDEPALSDEVKDSLARFSDATSDLAFARLVVRQLCEAPQGAPERPPFPFSEELDALRRHRPDVLDDIRTLVTSGAVSSILRWPQTAAAFESFAADLAVDQRRGINLLGRVLQGGFGGTDGPARLGTAGA